MEWNLVDEGREADGARWGRLVRQVKREWTGGFGGRSGR